MQNYQGIINWLERKGHKLMILFQLIQCVLFMLYIVLYFSYDIPGHTLRFKIYATAVIALFTFYMLYFSYNSIKNAYFIELIAFLVMSTISSFILVYNFFNNLILETLDNSKLLLAVGILAVFLLILGNVVYFVSAYFAYGIFQDIFIDKLGAKLIFHSMFKWIHFHSSMVKLDTGMIAFLVITCLTFDNKEAWFDILDSCFLLVAVVQAFVFRKMVRNENFRKVVFWLVLRFLFDVFKLYRNIKFITKEDKSKDFFVDNFGETIVIGALVLNEIIFLLIIFASFVCERNFGKGLKEMILEQNQNLEFAGDL